MKTILIVGLGNPGKHYAKTRHNAGFAFADYFWSGNRESFSNWEFRKKINGDISTGRINNNIIILLKPRTFMNLSGASVAAAKKFYKVRLENIIVAHDEIDLLLGSYKFSVNRSSAGHKGVQNIIDVLGTKNFTRFRIGVDNRGGKKILTEKYVLGKFLNTELKTFIKTLEKAVSELKKITK